MDVRLVDCVVSVVTLHTNFVFVTTCNILVGVHVERHTIGHSKISLDIWASAVVIQNLTVIDRTIQVILVIEIGLPSVPDKSWGNCLIVRNLVP